MTDIENPSRFYLGREHDLSSGQTAEASLLYNSQDLTTHAVCVGMTGSGKTGLCVSLLEEAALDGVPAICIDPKGDLGNLLLGFPKLRPQDFRPWVDPSVADRQGITVDELAQQTATLWKNGLTKWGQQPERIERLNNSVERLIFTPGASHGLPMTVLKSFNAPPQELKDDTDAYRQRVTSNVTGLLALLDIDADPIRSREHIFLSTLLTQAWDEGRNLDIRDLIREIQNPPLKEVGVMPLDDFFPEKKRTDLAMKMNNLLASPSFAGWMGGQPLDVQSLLFSPEGKPRHSIVSIAHLDDAQRMFFVTILLNEVLAWMRTQPGTSNLRALLYMDEVFGYFPPTANPPSKIPMLTLLKQARAFGLGCVLATQNPVDLDYKGLSNAGTWFLGRLQTERDKLRVIEGLEGASTEAGSSFDKQKMEATLAGVGSRVFLMNNVHEDSPRVFHTRWALSYLCGPLSREQIRGLMDPLRERFTPPDDPDREAEQVDTANGDETEAATTPELADDVKSVSEASKKKIDAAKVALGNRSRELLQGVLVSPFVVLFDLGYRVLDYAQARRRGGATKRRGSSVFAATSRAGKKMDQLIKTRGQWRQAWIEHQVAKGLSADEAEAKAPLLPTFVWLVILGWLVLLIVVAVSVFSWLMMSTSPPGLQA